MFSLVAYARHAGLSLALLLVADTAAAAVPVTTGETDSGEPPLVSVVIVDPLDGATLEGTPDAVVSVQIEYAGVDGAMVRLNVDDVPAPYDCAEQISPCSLKVTLAPGMHTLVATAQAFADESPIESDPVTVEVVEGEATTGGAPTSGDTGSDSSGSSGSTGSTGDASDPDGDKGCACSTRSGAPDLLGLALAALALPWPRRRRR